MDILKFKIKVRNLVFHNIGIMCLIFFYVSMLYALSEMKIFTIYIDGSMVINPDVSLVTEVNKILGTLHILIL